jgi:iron only hydrogenase large subunit-like protein
VPLLCSTCPGWVCYAEKRHAHAVPHMSGTRSPQQLLGALVKRAGALPGIGAADRVYHASLMMCYDKKLEASRGEYMDDLARDVDCVVTTSELVELMAQAGVSFADRARALEASLPAEASSGPGAAAGEPDAAIGVLAAAVLPPAPVTPSLVETVMRIAARELFGIADTGAIHFVPTRNPDLREATIHPPAGHAGKPLLFAVAHGFRNIQSVLRAVKRGVSKHDYVEVMACPSGCVNGGGQAKIGDGFDGDARALLAAVRAAMDQGKCNSATAECDKVGGSAAEQPTVEASLAACGGGSGDGGGVGAGSGGRSYQADTDVLALYERMLNKHTELLRTTFHAHVPVPQDGSVAPNPLTLQW